MKYLCRLCQKFWQRLPYRFAITGLFAAMVGVGVGRNFLGSVSVVSGPSMAPTYQEGTRVFTTPLVGLIDRGDIVVLDDGGGDYAIKRIVGLPGETVYIYKGYVFIDRKILLEPYIPKRIYTFPRIRSAVFVLGSDQYFVLGDNRPCSADSRLYGPVDRKQLKKRIPVPEGGLRARFGPVVLPPYGDLRHVRPVSKWG